MSTLVLLGDQRVDTQMLMLTENSTELRTGIMCLHKQRPEHLAQTARGADESPPATTKASVTGKEKF